MEDLHKQDRVMRRITSRLSRESSEKPAVVGRVDRIRLRTRPSLNHRSALWPSPTVVCNLDYPANRVSAVAEINQKVKKKKADQTEHALTHARTVAVHLRTYALTHPTNHCNDFYLVALSPDYYCLAAGVRLNRD